MRSGEVTCTATGSATARPVKTGEPVILLIHGITSSSATWDPVLPELASDAHVIAPDLLGRGGVGQTSRGLFAGALASILRDLSSTSAWNVSRSWATHSRWRGGDAVLYRYPEYCEADRAGRRRRSRPGGERRSAVCHPAGAEFVLPIIASTKVRDAGAAVGRVLGRLPMRPRPSVAEVVGDMRRSGDDSSRRLRPHLRSVVEPGGQRVSAHDRLRTCPKVMPNAHHLGQLTR